MSGDEVMVVTKRDFAIFIILALVSGLALGWLGGSSEPRCAAYESGRMCIEVNAEGEQNIIFHDN